MKYPIGIQTFGEIRNHGYVYVDKTRYIYDMVSSGKYYFLSRPRRFGKSLLLSTIEAYFKGQKELFEGLYIAERETQWQKYPVLRFDLSGMEGNDTAKLLDFLSNRLAEFETLYGVKDNSQALSIGDRFGMLIDNIAAQGSKVVILIDEYDKGIVDVLEDEKTLAKNQEALRSFFTHIKSKDENIRFAFITGVSRFHHLTIFSGFNNPNDISMQTRYASICGITQDELIHYFDAEVGDLARAKGISKEDAYTLLEQRYDGYRFTSKEEYVFNPFSLLNSLSDQAIKSYWIRTGTSKVFLKYLMHSSFDITRLEEAWISENKLTDIFSSQDPLPLLFQTGYLTIAEADDDIYRLQIPNGEVREALIYDLLPKYMGVEESMIPLSLKKLGRMVRNADIDGFMTLLKSLIASVPYHLLDIPQIEKTYHLILYQIFLMLGIDAQSEIAVSGGRIDMVVATSRYVYVMEFKLDGSAEEALNQIDEKGYALQWEACGREVFKIGINFSSKTHTIDRWLTK